MSEPTRIFAFTEPELEAVIVRAVELALSNPNGAANHNGDHTERWLTPDEAAAMLTVSTKWIYRHARKWQFVRRPTRKLLLISEAGLTRWLAAKNKPPA